MLKRSTLELVVDTMADPTTYAQMTKEQEDAIIADVVANKLRGRSTFPAICLTGGAEGQSPATPDARYWPIRVRPIDIHDSLLENPCAEKFKDSPEEIARLMSLHPLAFGIKPMTGGDRTPAFGERVNCEFLIAGPRNQGRLQGIRYTYPTGPTNYNFQCANAELQSLVGQFQSIGGVAMVGGTMIVPSGGTGEVGVGSTNPGEVVTGVSNGQHIKGRLNFTWEQLKRLAALGIFEPLLEHIRGHECSVAGCATRNFGANQYDAFNYKGGYRMGNTKYLPKPLSHYTIEQVRSHWQGKRSVKGHKMFATGGYQIIPKTLGSAIKRIKGLNTAEIYNKSNQDALGVYLVTMKRNTLGKYLFGANNSALSAGNELAFEFASIRLQRAAKRKGKLIPAYVKYYGGVGSNKAGAVNKADAMRTMKAINTVRQAIDTNATAKAILQEQASK